MADYKILTIPFARDAVPDMVNDIPNDPSISEPQLASFKQGFPSITTIPLVAGGIPPEGQDFNGILRDITQHIVHQNKGGMYKFEPEVVADGGYPEGAVLAANDGLSLWVSLVDANVEDFNTGTPTQWARIAFSGLDALLNGKVDKASIVQVTGASTTNIMSQKAVTDALSAYGQPSMTGSATLNGTTNNTVQLTGIAATLGLEVGDVIRIQYSGYNKLHSVESITNNDSIVVNYEHAGNRSNGSLRLSDTTVSATITRIAKWYNAPIGLGQAWVNVTRTGGVTYNHPYAQKRGIMLIYEGGGYQDYRSFIITTNGQVIAQTYSNSGGQVAGSWVGSVNDSYKVDYTYNLSVHFFEMR